MARAGLINLLLSCTLFLSGCSRSFMDTNFTEEAYNSKDSAVIIMRSALLKEEYGSAALETCWRNLNTGEFFIANKKDTFLGTKIPSNKFSILALQPGRYELDYINDDSNFYFYYPLAISRNSVTFEVTAGEVLYIGDLILKSPKQALRGKPQFEVRDASEAARKALEDLYPQFANKLQTSLINVSPVVTSYFSIRSRSKITKDTDD